jgi:VWFA-related protein
VTAAVSLALLAGASAPAQSPATFPSKVELVTVDVVVVDAKGHPVPGLTREDFTVDEDGRRQEIVSFEAFASEPPASAPARAAAPALASNEADGPRTGRGFAFVLDDLGMTHADATSARQALATFLDRSAGDGDEVTLATTSGDAWWSARLPEGRDDLLAVAARVKGRGAEPSTSFDSMSDYEAFWIREHDDAAGGQILQRVVDRWIQAQVCITGPGGQRPESCRQMVRSRAAGIDDQRRSRTRAVLTTVRRSLQALAPVRGRKALLLFARGMLDDSTAGFREVAAASREASTAVYFVNARGLTTSGGAPSITDATAAPDPSLFGRMAFEESVLDTAGARGLAQDTGGFSIVNTNDLAAGADRIAEESRVFYMLGFEAPPGKAPGIWRDLRVNVRGEGLTVRARRGYTLRASGADSAAKEEGRGKGGTSLPPAVERALDSAHEAAGIPLRAMAYVFEPRGKDAARVLVAAEFDASRLTFQGTGKGRAAHLEVTVAATSRDTGKTQYSDARVEVRAAEGEATGWRSVAREFDVRTGVAQARIVVRDPASDTLGAVSQRFEVPAPSTFHLATPMVTDQIVRPPGGEGRPRAALAVHRVFRPGATLYCEFEVFGAARHADGTPHVVSGLQVRTPEGAVVRQAPPTRISADKDGRVVRLLGLGLEGLSSGSYELVLDVRDEVSQGEVERREPFTIAP